ncbi:MAG: helix-turn-helix transcriptional regulator [Lachnospiraceae bacterium]|nr:helix-turn-helix transcriptional regulator [Lachnospiraceae bacterium]
MAIRLKLDEMMKKRGKGLTELAGEIDITLANLSILKNNKARAVRFSTLAALCRALKCQPGDLLEYVEETEGIEGTDGKDNESAAREE